MSDEPRTDLLPREWIAASKGVSERCEARIEDGRPKPGDAARLWAARLFQDFIRDRLEDGDLDPELPMFRAEDDA